LNAGLKLAGNAGRGNWRRSKYRSCLHREYTRSAILDRHWKPSSHLATAQSPVTETETFFSVFAHSKVVSNDVPEYKFQSTLIKDAR
jgi:hypothetical protein